MKRAFFALLIQVGSIIAIGNTCQAGDQGDFVSRSWSREDGLPQNSVLALAHSSDGYLWIGTREGLARFDGRRFTNYGLSDGLGGDIIMDLKSDPSGGMWIATYGGGLSRWHDGKMSTINVEDGLASNFVSHVCLSPDGKVWVGGMNGLQCLDQDELSRLGKNVGLPEEEVTSMTIDPRGGLWVSFMSGGLYRYQDGQSEKLDAPPIHRDIRAHYLFVSRDGALWVSIGNGKLLKHKQSKWTEFNQSNGLPYSFVSCITQADDGSIWVGTHEQGVYALHGDKFSLVRSDGEKDTTAIQSMVPGPEGMMWVGTSLDGLTRFTPRLLNSLHIPRIDKRYKVHGFSPIGGGKFWMTTYGGGVYQGEFAVGTKQASEKLEAHRSAFPLVALRQGDGSLSVGGIGHFQRYKADGSQIPMPSLHLDVLAMCESRDGNVWLGTRNGRLLKYDVKRFHAEAVGEFAAPISGLFRGKGDSLWITTLGDGIHLWDHQQISRWGESEGLHTDVIQTAYLDQDGCLWIGSRGAGLYSMKKGKISPVKGLFVRSVSQIQEDDEGNLWLGTPEGIIRANKQFLLGLKGNHPQSPAPIVLNESDGLIPSECGGGFCPSSYRDAGTGKLYFSTVEGIVEIEPGRFDLDPPTYIPVVESFHVDGVSTNVQFDSPIMVGAGARNIDIGFAVLDFAKPHAIKCRYYVEGLHDDWVGVERDHVIRLSKLPPGEYSLVISSSRYGYSWSPESAPLKFTVEPHYWQTGWFRFLMALSLILAGIGVALLFARHRLKQLENEARLARAEAEAQEYQREAQEHGRLASLGNLSASIAHEIKQPLTAIMANAQSAQMHLKSSDPSLHVVSQILSDITTDNKRAVDVVERVKNIVTKQEPKLKKVEINQVVLSVTRHLSLNLKRKGFTLATNLADDLPPVLADHVQLEQVLLNLITNACEAGNKASEHDPSIIVTSQWVSGGKNEIRVTVRDHGSGLAEGDEERVFAAYHTTKPDGMGMGLSLSKTIILAHRGRIWYRRAEGGGAEFSFTLPAAKSTE